MPKTTQKQKREASDPEAYRRFDDSVKAGTIGTLYFLHGDERYILAHSLSELRKKLCPEWPDSFNYRLFDNGGFTADELDNAVNTFPMFSERTLVEIRDFNIFGEDEGFKMNLSELHASLPPHVCVVYVFDTIEFKPDRRRKYDAAILKPAETFEFALQTDAKLAPWIRRRFKSAGKEINASDALYLATVTEKSMYSLQNEIEKIAAYATGEDVTRADIDAVASFTFEAETYKLTDALLNRDFAESVRILSLLLQNREAAHKLLFTISLKMRQLLAVSVLIDDGASNSALVSMFGMKYDFQLKPLLNAARKLSLAKCRDAVQACFRAATDLNNSSDPDERLIELIAELALVLRGAGALHAFTRA